MIAVIENAIIDRLKTAAGLDYCGGRVESYGGQLDTDDIAALVKKFPAIWVTFAGKSKPVRHGPASWLVSAVYVVMVGSRNVRNERASRMGTVGGDVGTYQMLDDVESLLLGQDFGLACARFEPGAVRTLYNSAIRGQAMSVFSQEWHTQYVLNQPAGAVVDWLLMGADYGFSSNPAVVVASDFLLKD